MVVEGKNEDVQSYDENGGLNVVLYIFGVGDQFDDVEGHDVGRRDVGHGVGDKCDDVERHDVGGNDVGHGVGVHDVVHDEGRDVGHDEEYDEIRDKAFL